MVVHIASGIGKGPTKLAAFDTALNHAGIANYNLLKLSSVIPPKTQIKLHDSTIPSREVGGQWGDRLYVVIAEKRVDTPNVEAWAGIGWVQDKETGKGLFVEHEGNSKQAVERNLKQTLEALMAMRNVEFGSIQTRIVGDVCKHHPVCVLVVAVYQASDWENVAHLNKSE